MIYYYFSHFEWILLLVGNKICCAFPSITPCFTVGRYTLHTHSTSSLPLFLSSADEWWILRWMLFLSSKWFSWFRLRDLLPPCTLFSSICHNSFLCLRFLLSLSVSRSLHGVAFTSHARRIILNFSRRNIEILFPRGYSFDIVLRRLHVQTVSQTVIWYCMNVITKWSYFMLTIQIYTPQFHRIRIFFNFSLWTLTFYFDGFTKNLGFVCSFDRNKKSKYRKD